MMTGNITSIARPYAHAVFEFALANNALSQWEELLRTASIVAIDPLIVQLMKNPQINKQQLADLFCDVLTSELDDEKKNFIHLLAEHKRFAVLPTIAEQFIQLRADYEKKITVEVISAVPLDDKQKNSISQALTKRLKRQVSLECREDADLIGGAVIRAGDEVIDASIRGKLNRLVEFI